MKSIVVFIILLFSVFQSAFADFWASPEVKKFYSDNGKYIVEVYPTVIPQKYYKWAFSKPKKKSKFSTQDTTIIYCHAILYKVKETDTLKIWDNKLINRVAPVYVIVGNDGKSIITFDNWFSTGYGTEVMVLYDQNGNLKKRYNLEDITPFPINEYMFSVSSIHWKCGAKYVSNEEVEICFRTEDGRIKEKKYNVITRGFQEDNEDNLEQTQDR